LKQPGTSAQIEEMMREYKDMIKIVVDIRRRVLSGVEKCTPIANRFC
jgi:hypothetical protein